MILIEVIATIKTNTHTIYIDNADQKICQMFFSRLLSFSFLIELLLNTNLKFMLFTV